MHPLNQFLPPRMWLACYATLCLLATVPAARAQESSADESLSFVHENTLAVMRIDVSDIVLPETLADESDGTSADTAKRTLQQRLETLAQLVGDSPLYLQLDMPSSPARIPVAVVVPDRPGLDPEALNDLLGFDPKPQKVGSYWRFWPSAAPGPSVQMSSSQAEPSPAAANFQAALRAADEAPIQLAVVPPEHVYRTFSELLTELPEKLGGGPISLITEGMQWAVLSADLKVSRWALRVQSASPAAANALAERLPDMTREVLSGLLTAGGQDPSVSALVEQLSNSLEVSVTGDSILLRVDEAAAAQTDQRLFAELLKQMAGPIGRQAKMKRFKQIGLAMHNYASVNKAFPPAQKLRDADGKSGLSWRVHILPFVGEAELYQRFALDEPWDSPTNIQLLEEMPDVYSTRLSDWLVPADVQPGYTCIQAPYGEKTIFGSPKAVSYGNITDGTSNTLFTVEVTAELAVPWTAPRDYVFDRAHPAQGLAIINDGFVAGMADGSVHFLPADLPDETLLRLFEMNDGEVVNW